MAYVYKILMNSLYARLGINPKSTIIEVMKIDTKICSGFVVRFYFMISLARTTTSFHTIPIQIMTMIIGSQRHLKRKSAVQLAAAITASDLIYNKRGQKEFLRLRFRKDSLAFGNSKAPPIFSCCSFDVLVIGNLFIGVIA